MSESKPIYFVSLKVNPQKDSPYFGKGSIAYCQCWVRTKNKNEAIKQATDKAADMGLALVNIEGTRLASREFWLDNPQALAVFDYATANGIGAIIDTYENDPLENN